MKHLLIDALGIYDKNGNPVVYDKTQSINTLIDTYGFEYSELTDKQHLDGRRILSSSPCKTTIHYDNEEAFLLLHGDFIHYNNLAFPNEYMVATSYDGVNWRTKIGTGFLTGIFNISLTTTNMSKMTDSEREAYRDIKQFINDNAKLLKSVDNSDSQVKYLLIKLNSNKLDEVNTIIGFTTGTIQKNEVIDVSYTKEKITVKNSLGTFIYNLSVRVNQSNYIKNTMEEFK
jgi:hypothetical protein